MSKYEANARLPGSTAVEGRDGLTAKGPGWLYCSSDLVPEGAAPGSAAVDSAVPAFSSQR